MALNVSPQFVRGGKSPWATIKWALQEREGRREEGGREGGGRVGREGRRQEVVQEGESGGGKSGGGGGYNYTKTMEVCTPQMSQAQLLYMNMILILYIHQV